MTSALCAQEAQEAEEGADVPRKGSREAVQLSLQGSLLDYQKLTVAPDQSPESSMQPEEQKASSTSYGLLGSGFGVGVGYAWDQLLLGARAQLTTTTVSRAGGREAQASTVALLPRLEYMFDGGSTRPFIAALVGVEHGSSSQSVDSSEGSGKVEDSSTRFGLGAAFGIHAFLNQAVSLDPEFSVLYGEGSGTVKTSGDGFASLSQDYSLSVIRVLLTVGLSGWIDTGGAPPPLPPRYETPPTAAPPAVAAPVVIDEPEAKPVSADIRLPNYRRLYLQVFKDAAQPAVLLRLTEPRNSFALRACDNVAIWENGSPIKLVVRSHGEHYLTGRLPIRGLEVLVGNADSTISVCAERWQLGQESREAVQTFLNARRELIDLNDDSETPAPPLESAPTPASEAPPAPPADRSAPSTRPAAPPTPTGAFPAAPEAAPAGRPAPPPKVAPPKK